MASALSFDFVKPWEPDEGVTVTQARLLTATMNAAIATTGLRPRPHQPGSSFELDIIIGMQELLSRPNLQQKLQREVQLWRGVVPAMPPPPPAKKGRKKSEPEPSERQWTVPEAMRENNWTNNLIHELFDFDPDCLRKGNPERHWDPEQDRMVEGYVTILTIPDHCIQREKARMRSIMKVKKPKKPRTGPK